MAARIDINVERVIALAADRDGLTIADGEKLKQQDPEFFTDERVAALQRIFSPFGDDGRRVTFQESNSVLKLFAGSEPFLSKLEGFGGRRAMKLFVKRLGHTVLTSRNRNSQRNALHELVMLARTDNEVAIEMLSKLAIRSNNKPMNREALVALIDLTILDIYLENGPGSIFNGIANVASTSRDRSLRTQALSALEELLKWDDSRWSNSAMADIAIYSSFANTRKAATAMIFELAENGNHIAIEGLAKIAVNSSSKKVRQRALSKFSQLADLPSDGEIVGLLEFMVVSEVKPYLQRAIAVLISLAKLAASTTLRSAATSILTRLDEDKNISVLEKECERLYEIAGNAKHRTKRSRALAKLFTMAELGINSALDHLSGLDYNNKSVKLLLSMKEQKRLSQITFTLAKRGHEWAIGSLALQARFADDRAEHFAAYDLLLRLAKSGNQHAISKLGDAKCIGTYFYDMQRKLQKLPYTSNVCDGES